MKVGDLVKPKSEWKHVRYDPQEVKCRIGIVVKIGNKFNINPGAMILWQHGEVCYSPLDELVVIA